MVRSRFGDGKREIEVNKNIKNEIIKKNMANKEPGYVYILTNPSFREDWVKIGKSDVL